MRGFLDERAAANLLGHLGAIAGDGRRQPHRDAVIDEAARAAAEREVAQVDPAFPGAARVATRSTAVASASALRRHRGEDEQLAWPVVQARFRRARAS